MTSSTELTAWLGDRFFFLPGKMTYKARAPPFQSRIGFLECSIVKFETEPLCCRIIHFFKHIHTHHYRPNIQTSPSLKAAKIAKDGWELYFRTSASLPSPALSSPIASEASDSSAAWFQAHDAAVRLLLTSEIWKAPVIIHHGCSGIWSKHLQTHYFSST